jgi:hypothetical protein
MWLAEAFQAHLANAVAKPQEPRLHIRRKAAISAPTVSLRISTR